MAGINEITMDNVTRIALPNQQNEIKKDAPQVNGYSDIIR